MLTILPISLPKEYSSAESSKVSAFENQNLKASLNSKVKTPKTQYFLSGNNRAACDIIEANVLEDIFLFLYILPTEDINDLTKIKPLEAFVSRGHYWLLSKDPNSITTHSKNIIKIVKEI